MTLRVEFDQFAEAAKRVLGGSPVYVVRTPRGVLVTAAAKDILLTTETVLGLADATAHLRGSGLEVHEGHWSHNGSDDTLPYETYVVAIAYMSGDGKPGLWVDGCAEEPTPTQALRSMFEEMTSNGEVAEVPFDDFARAANPNIVILSPATLQQFALENREE